MVLKERTDHGATNRRAELSRGVEHAGGRACDARLDVAHGDRGHRGEGHPHAGAGDDRGEQEGEPRRIGAGDEGKCSETDGEQRDAGGQDVLAADSIRHPPGKGGKYHRRHRHRSEREAGGQRGETAHRLQVDRDWQKKAEHAEADSRGDPVGDREVPLREQRKWDQGLDLETLPDDEDDDQGYSCDDDLRDRHAVSERSPVVALAFDEPENDREQAGRREDDAKDVPAVMATWAQDGKDDEGPDQSGEPYWNVDEEDPAPVDVGNDGAPNRRAGQGGQPRGTAPDTEGRATALRREQRGDDGKRLGCQQRPADALETASGDELADILRAAAG